MNTPLTAQQHQTAAALVAAFPDAVTALNAHTEELCRSLVDHGACAELKPRDTKHGQWAANPAYVETFQAHATQN